MHKGFTVLLAVAALLLSGCAAPRTAIVPIGTPSASVTVAPTSGPVPRPEPSFPAAPEPAPSASSASIRHAYGSGCSTTAVRMPVTRFTATIGDVDGDGRNDTEWATIPRSGYLEFGVTTASGATVMKRVGFASGGGRSVSIGTLATGQTVALPTDGHAALVYVLRDCRWIEPELPSGSPGTDFVTGYYDPPANGGGCIGRRLYQVDFTRPSKDHYTVTGVTEHLSSDGRRMTAGKQVTFLTNTDVSIDDRGARYGDGLCSPSSVLHPEYTG